MPEIAKNLGVSKTSILNWMKEYGIPRRSQGESLSLTMKKKWKEPEYKANMMKYLEEYWSRSEERSYNAKELWKNPNFKTKMSQIHKELWRNPEYRSKVTRKRIEGLMDKPTKPEIKIIQLIERIKLPFRYCGDGSFVIGTLNPDFVSIDNSKRVIEVFGRAFHDPEESFKDEIPWYQQYWGRMAYFSQLRYACLILWDDKLENIKEVTERIERFLN